MIRSVRRIFADFLGLARVCGWGVASHWLWQVVRTFKECRRDNNLQPADIAMGEGPFVASYKGKTARLSGQSVISGIREIWVREVYLARGFLKIGPNATVVDLGANMGNFTMLALAMGENARVIAVEPSQAMRRKLSRQLEMNAWTTRVYVVPHFVGGRTQGPEPLINEDTVDCRFISEDEFIESQHLKQIDLLKSDIDGSEFELLRPNSRLLAISQQVAIELHGWGGNIAEFTQRLRDCGFEIRPCSMNSEGCILSARRNGV